MNDYIKKPIPVKAVQIFNTRECINQLSLIGITPVSYVFEESKLICRAGESEMTASEGDYIIREDGAYSICLKGVFEETYDAYGEQTGGPA